MKPSAQNLLVKEKISISVFFNIGMRTLSEVECVKVPEALCIRLKNLYSSQLWILLGLTGALGAVAAKLVE